MKTALVTGADRGFGWCISRELLRKGYTVFAGRYLDDYSLLESLSNEFPCKLYPVKLDVESRASILEAFNEVSALTDHLDVFVSNAAFMGGEPGSTIKGEQPINTELMEKSVRANAVGPLQITEVFLPLFDKGEGKRLCYISSEVSSVNMMQRDSEFRYCMSKTALNMAVRMLHNTLYPKGYTFRLYQPGWMRRMMPDGTLHSRDDRQIDPQYSAAQAIELFISSKPDEQRLELVDYLGSGWPF